MWGWQAGEKATGVEKNLFFQEKSRVCISQAVLRLYNSVPWTTTTGVSIGSKLIANYLACSNNGYRVV